MTTWKQERDLLISETLAFVQSVAGKTTDAGRQVETRLPPVSPAPPAIIDRPADLLPARPSPISDSGLRDEIHRRVAAFRARQQAFHRDRNDYCDAMMEKVRASSEAAVENRDTRLPKR
jgi:hypothetical protein